MTESKDGGPAFPGESSFPYNPESHFPGMTLRDWFAGMALGALVSNSSRENFHHDTSEIYSSNAYILADAMLAERKKEKK